ncbi:MAG: sigma-70 family RNA polymerase sigma factor [Clostridia bacterium]
MEEQSLRTDDCAENVIIYYSDMIYNLAFARSGTKHDADDIFQEVFLRYVRKKPVFADEEHRKAWLIRVTVNCTKKLWTSAWKRKTQPLLNDISFEEEDVLSLYNELQKLPIKYREVIHLFYYENMSLLEISRALGRKNSTVRTQLTRARAMLREFMKEEDYV